jgi:hypothetical protein
VELVLRAFSTDSPQASDSMPAEIVFRRVEM